MILFVFLCGSSSVFAANGEVMTHQTDKKSLNELMHDQKVAERWRDEKLLVARETPKVMGHNSAVDFLNGLEELHYAYRKRHEYFETVLRMIHINGNSLEPSETIKKILNCVKDLETTWKKHEGLLLGKGCQDAINGTDDPLLAEPQIKDLLPSFATAAVQYYETIPLFDEEVKASPLAKIFTS